MTKKFVALLVLFVLIFNSTSAVDPIIPDIFVINGERYETYSKDIMNAYFQKYPERQPLSRYERDIIRIIRLVSTFEIIQNELWVVDIDAHDRETILKYRFGCMRLRPRLAGITEHMINVTTEILDGRDRMKVDWFSGLIVATYGTMIRNENEPAPAFGRYERYNLLQVENGNVIRNLNMNLEEFLEFNARQFELYKKTAAFENRLERFLRDGRYTEEQAMQWFNNFFRWNTVYYLDAILEE